MRLAKLTDEQKIEILWNALARIAKAYQTPNELRRNSERDYACSYEEAIEMAYENIQQEAKDAIKRVRRPKRIVIKQSGDGNPSQSNVADKG